MLNRMKKMLKKEKGFTLVELLAVLVILGIIVAIAVPAIGSVIGDAEDQAEEANVDLVKNAYRLAEVGDEEVDRGQTLSLNQLVEKGYLEEIPDDFEGEDEVSRNEEEEIVFDGE